MPSVEFDAHEVRDLLWRLADIESAQEMANTEVGHLLGRMIDALPEDVLLQYFTVEELRWEIERRCHDSAYALTQVGSRLRKRDLVRVLKGLESWRAPPKKPPKKPKAAIPDVFDRLNGESVV